MTYIIKRETLIPWDQSVSHFTMDGDTYDIVESHKNSGLDGVSDYIIDHDTIIKCPMNESVSKFRTIYKNHTGTDLMELILG